MYFERGLPAIANWSTEQLSGPEMLYPSSIRFDPTGLTGRSDRWPWSLRVIIEIRVWELPVVIDGPAPSNQIRFGMGPVL